MPPITCGARTCQAGWTGEHEQIIKLAVAYGDDEDYLMLVENTKLISNEPAFAKLRPYAQERKQAFLKSKYKQKRWKDPTFDNNLLTVFW